MNIMPSVTLLFSLTLMSLQTHAMIEKGEKFLEEYPNPYSKAYWIKRCQESGDRWRDQGGTIAVLNPEGTWLPYQCHNDHLTTGNRGILLVKAIKDKIESKQFEKLYYRRIDYSTTWVELRFLETSPLLFENTNITGICCFPKAHEIQLYGPGKTVIHIKDSAAIEQILTLLQAARCNLPSYPHVVDYERRKNEWTTYHETRPE